MINSLYKEFEMQLDVDRLWQEYPFLQRVVLRKSIYSAKVLPWDEDFLSEDSFLYYSIDGEIDQRIYLLAEDGEVITRVGRTISFLPFITNKNERVNQAIIRLGNQASRVKFAAVLCELGTLRFFKLPKGSENAQQFREVCLAKK